MKKILYLIISCLISFSAAAGDKEILQQAYSVVLDNYIGDVTIPDIFNPSLKALEKLDKNLKLIQEKNTLTVYYKGKIHKIYSRPKDEKDAKKWAEFANYLLSELKKISPELVRRDFELVDIMLYHGLREFDKNSHYYPVLEIGQENEKIQGYSASLLDNDVLYTRLGTINSYTTEMFRKTLEEHQKVNGIVLDLRGNRGGYLKQALEIIDAFLSDGAVIYTTGREEGKRKIYRAESGEWYKGVPMVVLIDGKTASSAEVIAQALKENERARLVGGQTYGKNTVQNIYKLDNDAYLALTTERFFSPRNVPIEEIGIRPNVCSEVFETSSDIDELLAYPYNFMCKKLSRNSTFDLDVALRVLEKQMQK